MSRKKKLGARRRLERGPGNWAKPSCGWWKVGEGAPAPAACVGFSQEHREQLCSCRLRKSGVAEGGYDSVWENGTTGILVFFCWGSRGCWCRGDWFTSVEYSSAKWNPSVTASCWRAALEEKSWVMMSKLRASWHEEGCENEVLHAIDTRLVSITTVISWWIK